MSTCNVSRREFLRLASLSAAVVAVAACATPPGLSPGAQEGAVPPSAETITVSFMGWGGIEEDEGIRAAIEQFQQENPGIQVTWLHTPENYVEKLLASIAAGTPPDSGFINDYIFQAFARDGVLLDITDLLETDPALGADDYFVQPQERERSTRDGRWYGIGSCWVAPHMFYNADLFEEVGIEPPSNDPDLAWDWAQFLEVARVLTLDANGRHPGESGFDVENVVQWGVHWPTWWWLPLPAVYANGGEVVDPETPALLLDRPEAVEAIQRIADLMLVHQVMPQAFVTEGLGMTSAQMLETRKLAMAVDGSWALASLYQIDATLGTAALPKMKQPATVLGGHMHGILAATKEPEASWAWLRFLASPWYETQFNRIGLWLPNQTSLLTEEGLKSWITEGIHPPGYELLVTKFVPQYGRFVPMPVGMQKVTNILDTVLAGVWIGDTTAEEALTQAVADANAAFQEEAARS